MKVAISGSTGLVGNRLVKRLLENDHTVIRLVRKNVPDDDTIKVSWSPYDGKIERERLEGIDAVVNLSGANLASSRWTEDRKKVLRDSRVVTTTFVSDVIGSLENKPKTMMSASATGYYGDTKKANSASEYSPHGKGFLSDLCREWEAATRPAANSGVRVVNGRFGVVLSTEDGALAKMLPVFKAGIGGHIGSGRQMMSWIVLEDLVDAIIFTLETESLNGPVNMVSPDPVTNKDFSKTLADVLGKPCFTRVPAFALKVALGSEMAEETLLASQNVVPEKLNEAGFEFRYPDLEGALKHALAEEQAG